MEKILRRVIISLFVFIMLVAVYFAMSVNGPGLPSSSASHFMMKNNGQKLSCFFPLFGCPDQD